MNEALLQIEIRVLLLRYGREKVLEALANVGDQTVDALREDIAAAEKGKAARKPRPTPAPELLVAETFRARPDLVPLVQALVSRYENRTFLPHIRDVHRFLDRLGATARPKARRAALGHVLKALARMDAADLGRLVPGTGGQAESDYAVLAREIMGGGVERKPES